MLELIFRQFMPGEMDTVAMFWSKRLLIALIIFSLFWVLAQLSHIAITRWGRKLASITRTDLDNRILTRSTPSISFLLVFLGVYFAILSLPLHGKLFDFTSSALYITTVGIVCLLVYRILHETLLWYAERQQQIENSTFTQQMAFMLEKLIMLLIFSLALVVVLRQFGYDVFSLVTALGIGSLAIGIAAKDTLSNFISGFTLMIDRPFRIGDRIQLAGGQTGDVHDVGLRSTKIRTSDNQVLIIPNSDLCNHVLLNYSMPNSRAKGRVDVGVGYDSDIEQVKALMVAVALDVNGVLADPAPEAYFTSFGDSALNMTIFFWVDNYTSLFATTDKVNVAMLQKFRAEEIEIPFPTSTVQLAQGQSVHAGITS